MRTSLIRRSAAGTVVAAVAAAGITTAASGKPYDVPSGGGATIKMNFDKSRGKKASYFTGPKTVKQGAQLKILNTTKVQQDGPHSFSLVDSPLTKGDQKALGHGMGPIADELIKAHKIVIKGPDDITIKRHKVDKGKTGWDTAFGHDGTTLGDSFYTEKQNESTSRKVTAAVGTKLHYFCLIHPYMQGTITVVK